MKPLVTIGIPTYRRFEYLQIAVASAQAQTYAPVEILISDDGTGERIGPWAENLARTDPRVRYQRNATNLGLAGNWNATAAAARGEWLMLIGDDDELLPECVERLVQQATSTTTVVFANHYLIDAAGRRLEAESRAHTQAYHRGELPAGPLVEPAQWIWRNAIPMCSAIVRRETVQRLRFQADLNTPEIEFFLRLANAGGEFVFCPDYLMNYRTHPASATASGLWSERLAEYLIPMPSPSAAEPDKQRFLADLLIQSVTRCLMQGDQARAHRFATNPYYPTHGPRKGVRALQQACVRLPGGAALYRAIYSKRDKWC